MRDEDKPFLTTKGPGRLSIAPRNRAGWIYTGLWMLPLAAISSLFVWIVGDSGDDTEFGVIATVGFVIVTIAWSLMMARWMYVRSEVIDVAELLREKRERDRERRKP